ncbi:MAG: DUF4366 domain-containing protein [Oscillospiraceae bacterium]|nr:DUF4366 domain-containing protein [Oscillospiraceae bacterium]
MRKNKTRLFTMLLAVMLCVAAFSTSALAYADDTAETAPNPVVSDEDAGTQPDALTPEGNLTLIDDIQQTDGEADAVENKQFITVQSKNGNTFYIVIDRSGDTENVYFLNLVDEADLMALMEDEDGNSTQTCTCTDKCEVGSINTECPVCKSNMSECSGTEKVVETTPEPETEPENGKTGSSTGMIALVLIVLLGGGGAVYYFKLRKNKPQTKGPDDLDDYDYGADDEDEDAELDTDDETVYEFEDENSGDDAPDREDGGA